MNQQTHQKGDEKKKKDDDDDEDQPPRMVYSFGYRYFYWNYYKVNIHRGGFKEPTNLSSDGLLNDPFQDWYIEKKHDTLKDEILNNNICTISNEQWEITLRRAQSLLDTDVVKRQ